ncbi:MAG: class I SAM-dependent methyltransferase [Candidatus Thorarchaeota archaeon]
MSDWSLTNALEKDGKYRQAVGQAFGSIAQMYDSWYQTPMGRYVWSVESDAVNAILPQEIHEVSLEIGVGTGMALTFLQQASQQLVGIDIAWQMLTIVRQKTLTHENVHLILSDGAHLPLRGECTNLILGMTILEFIADQDQFLHEIFRCLCPAGHLILGVLTSTNLWAIERRIRNLAQQDVFKLARFPSPWQVIRNLRENGFSQVTYRGTVYAPPFASARCLPAFHSLDMKLGTWWLSRAFGAFLVFNSRRSDFKQYVK